MGKSKSIPSSKFKDKAEELSANYRTELGLQFYSRLDAFVLAQHLKIPVIAISCLKGFSKEDLGHLLKLAEWHALTAFVNNVKFIVHNDFNSKPRQQSDLFHELAHIICEHPHEQPKDYENFDFLRSYNKTYEKEAEYLGAALHIPKGGLIAKLKYNRSVDQISAEYLASKQQVYFRLHETGARTIVSRIKAKQLKES